MELIDRQALLRDKCWLCGGAVNDPYAQGYMSGLDVAEMVIRAAHTVDAVPVVHGRWVRLDAHRGMEQFKCSICRSECYVPTCMREPMYDYCPNCGAKMDGGADDGTAD